MKIAVDLIMFDLDGTLADTGPDLADAVNFTRAHFKLEPLPNALVYSHVGYGVEHLLKHSLPQQDQFPEVMRVFLERYENHLLDKTVLYPGVLPALDCFRDKRRVVVTNKMHRLSVAIIRGLGVEDRFDAILGGDSVSDKKPHPALLNEVLQRYQVPPAKALMVGDGETDVEAGKRAGVVTCGVTYGLGNANDLRAAQPDFLIDDLIQLSDYFC
ncbi:MAG: HAD-IA family hydrolase [Deltaproteobacteria bacterium]|nr:HAD-IA family hydrolase [Deltaproteobacteria bacterium]MBI2181764.1 HAD-IA family hydrolase [Deltaproteobacteria bacterium]MBI2230317.1 HAD-IA family hydrolase [Deltaproteobacteria bacterium]MBI2368185.1 HAD-IA family hydrolase [Deltaproteobacteria bacterium]MBI2535235.1 HAD-IA family hydrolase [Deltaproteobacteria bacterium]